MQFGEPHQESSHEQHPGLKISRRKFLRGLGVAAGAIITAKFAGEAITQSNFNKAEKVGQAEIPIIILGGNFWPFSSQNYRADLGDYSRKTASELKIDKKIAVWDQLMPDPFTGSTEKWGPLVSKMSGPNTIAVGYSTGATELMYRLSRGEQFDTIILVAPYDTPELGQIDFVTQQEKSGGRFNEPFNYSDICKNVKHIVIITPDSEDIIPHEVTERVLTQFRNNAKEGQLTQISPKGTHDLDSSPQVLSAIERALYNALEAKKIASA